MKKTYSSISPFPSAKGYDGADKVELPARIWLFDSFPTSDGVPLEFPISVSFIRLLIHPMFYVLGFATDRGESARNPLPYGRNTYVLPRHKYVSHPVLAWRFLSNIGRR
jgi:hypothetical protein